MGTAVDRAPSVGLRRFAALLPPWPVAFGLVALGGAARGVWDGARGVELGPWVATALALWIVAGTAVAVFGGAVAPPRVATARVLRACALAATPALLLALRAVPLLEPAAATLWAVAHLGVTVVFVGAVRVALDTDLSRALWLSVATLAAGLLAVLVLRAWFASPGAV